MISPSINSFLLLVSALSAPPLQTRWKLFVVFLNAFVVMTSLLNQGTALLNHPQPLNSNHLKTICIEVEASTSIHGCCPTLEGSLLGMGWLETPHLYLSSHNALLETAYDLCTEIDFWFTINVITKVAGYLKGFGEDLGRIYHLPQISLYPVPRLARNSRRVPDHVSTSIAANPRGFGVLIVLSHEDLFDGSMANLNEAEPNEVFWSE
ncbi:hypothetical protein Sjap_026009 [Stephania japonica]|uniref:Uncharacterized protein n=1 Tax=Stephania japonica TaxID=461633 RepID=A0AAP0EAK6_9MAGN